MIEDKNVDDKEFALECMFISLGGCVLGIGGCIGVIINWGSFWVPNNIPTLIGNFLTLGAFILIAVGGMGVIPPAIPAYEWMFGMNPEFDSKPL